MVNTTLTLAQASPNTAPSGLWAWLLNLEHVDPAAGNLQLGWEHPIPGWVWLFLILGAFFFASFSYRHISGSRKARITLASIRALFILLILVYLSGPQLILPQTQIEQDHVLVLLDRSRSMTVADVNIENQTQRQTRNKQLINILNNNKQTFEALKKQHVLTPYAFADNIESVPLNIDLAEPAGNATAMRTAINEALQKVSGKPVSAVVIFSDGRTSEPLGQSTWEKLNRFRIPVFVVPLGAANPPANLALRVEAPDKVFIKDAVPVRTFIKGTAADGKPLTGPAKPGTKVRLVDKSTGKTLDEQPVVNYEDAIQLFTTPEIKQQTTWQIELINPEQELIVTDNLVEHDITIDDKPIRVLYIDGYPRWSYRYLKNMLVRETSIESSIMLMSADSTFAQEGDIPLKRLPKDLEEMKPYDVIIIGDVPADFFGAQRLKLFHDHVAKRGAGLIWLAGPDFMPASYASSQLADLLPMESSQTVSRMPGQINVQPTEIAKSLGVLRLRSPFDPNDKTFWPSELLPLYWAQSLGQLKIACEVLAEDQATKSPIVARMRFGAGQSLYIGTDEIWRWRYARGELYPQQFYMQLIRLLARNRLQQDAQADGRIRLLLSTRKAAVGDTIVLELSIEDQQLLRNPPETITLHVLQKPTEPNGKQQRLQTITLAPTKEPGKYRALWTPVNSGELIIKLAEDRFEGLNVQQILRVETVDDEMRHPVADHPNLKKLAEKTGGQSLTEAQIPELTKLIENRQRTRAMDITESIWNTPLALLLAVLLITIEWIGRKITGLT